MTLSTFDVPAALSGRDVVRLSPLSVYIHVPYCTHRCGYCDFNTYTTPDFGSGIGQDTYVQDAQAEIVAARELLGARRLTTVFIGGGTPTLLPAHELGGLLSTLSEHFDTSTLREVTVEANPESLNRGYLADLQSAGVTRVSIGMQSLAAPVLATLERRHSPKQALAMAHEARRLGLDVSLDLIYGTPGETARDWHDTLAAVIDTGIDHVSAYALTVEPHTPMGRKIRSGSIVAPDDDVAAQRYEVADEMLHTAGLQWYEISNWSRAGKECQHNLQYWTHGDWWGIGPGAHSHFDGTRWWNVKHPRTYAEYVRSGRLPVEDGETLSSEQRRVEHIMLSTRLATGFAWPDSQLMSELQQEGLVDRIGTGKYRLTRRGRLLADTVTMRLVTA